MGFGSPRASFLWGDVAAQCTVYGERGIVGRAKTAEPFDLPFRTPSGVGSMNRVIDVRARWRHMANTGERLCVNAASMGLPCTTGGDAACCQITLCSLVRF